MNLQRLLSVVVCAFALAGCAGYRWSSSVPEDMRTVSVPTFANGSSILSFGTTAATQLAREVQREGTFRLARPDDAALEIQGEILSAGSGGSLGNRRMRNRLIECVLTAKVRVSVVDRRRGKVLIDNRVYEPSTTYVANGELISFERDASARLAEELAREVVDDLVSYNWK